MAKYSTAIPLTILAIILASATVIGQEVAAPKAPQDMTISEIMIETNKKPTHLLRKVASGQASAQEKERLVELFKSMAAHEPPKGNLDDWKKRTELLVDAAQKAQQGTKDANKLLRKAANCTACHKEHKED